MISLMACESAFEPFAFNLLETMNKEEGQRTELNFLENQEQNEYLRKMDCYLFAEIITKRDINNFSHIYPGDVFNGFYVDCLKKSNMEVGNLM